MRDEVPADPAELRAAFRASQWHRDRVEAFAAWLGLRVRWDRLLLPGGHAYRGGQIAALGDVLRPWMALHDVAHWLLAPRWRRRRTNFGLGPAPQVHGREAPSRRLVSAGHARREESAAAVLTVFLARELLDPESAESAAASHVGMRGYDSEANAFGEPGYEPWTRALRRRGLVGRGNRVLLVGAFRRGECSAGGSGASAALPRQPVADHDAGRRYPAARRFRTSASVRNIPVVASAVAGGSTVVKPSLS